MKSDKTSRTMGPLMDTQAWVSACFLFSEGAFNTFKVKLSVFLICLLFYLFYFHFYSWCSQFLCPSLTLSPPLFLPFFFCFYGRSFKVVQVFLLFTSGSSSAKEKLKLKHFCYIYILDISTKHTGFRALFLYQICMFYWCFCDLYSGLEKPSGRHRRAVIPVRRKVAKILFYFKQIVQKFIVIGGYSWPFLSQSLWGFTWRSGRSNERAVLSGWTEVRRRKRWFCRRSPGCGRDVLDHRNTKTPQEEPRGSLPELRSEQSYHS